MAELPFFFDQPKRPLIKRKRRSMEQLPFSLPLTDINRTLKVEAITKQQSKIPNQSTKETLGDSQETDPNGEIQNGDFENNKEKIPSLLPTKTRDNQELPGISVDSCKEKVFVGFDANPSKDFYEEEEDEDTQRFLFQQNKFAAPNLLAQLGRLLEYFYEKQQEKMDGSVRNKSSDNWANLTSNNLNNTAINLGASYINIHALDIHVPFHLREKLKWNFYQLIANAVYSRREWQTTSYKQQAVSRHRDVGDESVAYDLSSSISSKVKRSQQDSLSMPKKLRKPHDEQNFGPLISETPQNIGKTGSSPSSNTLTDEPTQEIATSVLGFRRESTTPSIPFSAPRTRLEKYKYLPSSNASLLVPLRRRKKSSTGQQSKTKQETEPDREKVKEPNNNNVNNNEQVPGQAQPLLSSITFSLMSKACENKGWINYESQKDDLERITIVEWAHNRLLQSISSRAESTLKAKEKGEDGPLIVRQYGESRGDFINKLFGKNEYDPAFLKQLKEAKLDIVSPQEKGEDGPASVKQFGDPVTNKSKKEKSKVPGSPPETPKLKLFLIILPDETTTLYYPSGRMAVCVAKNLAGEGKYTYVYDDDDEDSLIAYFTPSNAFCYDKERKQFLCTSKEATIYDKEGEVEKKWSWKAGRLLPALLLEFNRYLTLRVVSHNVMTLHYNAKPESYKFMVGVIQDGPIVRVHEMVDMKKSAQVITETASQPVTKPKPKNKREEKKAKTQKASLPVENEVEKVEQRKEELDKKFPERRKLVLDLRSDVELYKLRRRIKNITYEWMESYRLLVGMSSPIKVPSKQRRRRELSSAKSLPGTLPSSQHALHKLDHKIPSPDQRAPSAPPIPPGKNLECKVRPFERLHCLAEGVKERGVPVHFTEAENLRGSTSPRPPFRCGLVRNEPRSCSPKEGCTVALRAEILGEKYPCCRCRKRQIPFISDIEYDLFIREHVPQTQLLVVSIVSSRRPGDTPCMNMLERLYYEKNRNRSFPCAQARNDPFRIVLYDVDRSLNIEELLLVKRHNVVPGMFLMYIGGKLLFADHIFNGYGNARQDFLKQITKSRKDYLQGLFLPQDFRLSPTPCRSGPRAAWGGEIGGLSRSICRNESEMTINTGTPVQRGITSAVASSSSDSAVVRADGAKSAASFINLGLSIDSPFSRCLKRKPILPARKTAPQSRT